MKKTATQITIIAAVLAMVFLGGLAAGTRMRPDCPVVGAPIADTVVIRDTVRESIPVVKEIFTTRVDTIFVKLAGDTVYVAAEIPIERKTYLTDDYRAEIEGFRPSLVSMEVYRKTRFVTQTQTVGVPDSRRWGIGIQAGYGLSAQQGVVRAHPYIGVGIQYNFFTF